MKFLNEDYSNQTLPNDLIGYYNNCNFDGATFHNPTVNAAFYNCTGIATLVDPQIEFMSDLECTLHFKIQKSGLQLIHKALAVLDTHNHKAAAEPILAYAEKMDDKDENKWILITAAEFIIDRPELSWADFLISPETPKTVWDLKDEFYKDYPMLLEMADKYYGQRYGETELIAEKTDPTPVFDKYAPIRGDLKFTDDFGENGFSITAKELNEIISRNEPNDVFSVQAEIERLISDRQKGRWGSGLSIKIFSTAPFRLTIARTNDKDFWRYSG